MAAPKKYNSTAKGLMMWASHELEHVGRIAAVEDPDLQYSYAMSTLNGMAHLKDALFEYIIDNPKSNWVHDLQITHDKVVRVMKHLIKVYDLQIDTIVAFNTRKVLSSLNYLRETPGANNTRSIMPMQGIDNTQSIMQSIDDTQTTQRNMGATQRSMVPIQPNMQSMVPIQPNMQSMVPIQPNMQSMVPIQPNTQNIGANQRVLTGGRRKRTARRRRSISHLK